MKKGKSNGNREQKSTLRVIIVGCILVVLLIAFYYYVSHKTGSGDSEEAGAITKTQQVLLRNLDTNYPPSPKEVIKYYCDITQCFYNETHSDEELKALALQIQLLYDEELVSNQTQEEYMQNIISDIASMQKQGFVISSYSTSASTDVDYFKEDGYDWSKMYVSFSIRKGTALISTDERFLLRKDGDGHWKIYGWELVE